MTSEKVMIRFHTNVGDISFSRKKMQDHMSSLTFKHERCFDVGEPQFSSLCVCFETEAARCAVSSLKETSTTTCHLRYLVLSGHFISVT